MCGKGAVATIISGDPQVASTTREDSIKAMVKTPPLLPSGPSIRILKNRSYYPALIGRFDHGSSNLDPADSLLASRCLSCWPPGGGGGLEQPTQRA